MRTFSSVPETTLITYHFASSFDSGKRRLIIQTLKSNYSETGCSRGTSGVGIIWVQVPVLSCAPVPRVISSVEI